MCAQAIAFARLRRLYFGAADPKGGGVEHGARIFQQPTCHHRPEVIGGVQETRAAELLRLSSRRAGRASPSLTGSRQAATAARRPCGALARLRAWTRERRRRPQAGCRERKKWPIPSVAGRVPKLYKGPPSQHGGEPMATQRTLSIIKPDATRRDLTGAINKRFEEAGLSIVAQRRVRLTEAQARAFYAVHKERSFYNDLCAYMTSGPVVVQVLQGENAVEANRTIMGATNPANADEGTIRKDFGESVEANSVHGSDSPENAAIEIAFFFAETDIVG